MDLKLVGNAELVQLVFATLLELGSVVLRSYNNPVHFIHVFVPNGASPLELGGQVGQTFLSCLQLLTHAASG